MAETKLVIFRLGQEEYGVQVTDVQSIIPYEKAIKMPNTPNFIEGIINLRGDIVPIIDLKMRFNIIGDGIGSNTRIIVIRVRDKQIGCIVDEASQVLTIQNELIEPAPEIVIGIDRQYIVGVGKQEKRLIIIVDLNKIFSTQEVDQIQKVNQ